MKLCCVEIKQYVCLKLVTCFGTSNQSALFRRRLNLFMTSALGSGKVSRFQQFHSANLSK